MLKRTALLGLSICGALAATAATRTAVAADPAAGKTLAQQQQCASCHDPADWQGSSAAQIEDKIKQVVAGKVKHPKMVELSADQIADLAAYWASAAPH